jgi:hypothetical protein
MARLIAVRHRLRGRCGVIVSFPCNGNARSATAPCKWLSSPNGARDLYERFVRLLNDVGMREQRKPGPASGLLAEEAAEKASAQLPWVWHERPSSAATRYFSTPHDVRPSREEAAGVRSAGRVSSSRIVQRVLTSVPPCHAHGTR